jgi:hypothetical protein
MSKGQQLTHGLGKKKAPSVELLRSQARELSTGHFANQILGAMLTRYIQLQEFIDSGLEDGLTEVERARLDWELSGLGDRLFSFDPKQSRDLAAETIVGEMYAAGYSESERVEERLSLLANKRGKKARNAEWLRETIDAFALDLEGKTLCQIADRLCHSKEHIPHEDDTATCVQNPCANKFGTRIRELKSFLDECGFQFDLDVDGKRL